MILASALVVVAPRVAQGGQYQVFSCADAAGDINHAWTSANGDPGHLEQEGNCAVPSGADEAQLETSGLFSADQLGLSSGAPPGSSASWNFGAPAGTTIDRLSYHRHLGKNLDDDWKPQLTADGVLVPGETCAISGSASGCLVDGFAAINLNAHALALEVRCTAASGVCGTGSSLHHVFAALYASTVTISDPVPPTLTTPTGSIPAAAPGAFHSSTDTVTLSATDNVGIKQTTVYIDNQPLSTVPVACDYTYVVPCLQQPAVTHEIDWRSLNLADGPHTVQAAATDGAGNETRGPTYTVLTDTHPPTAPDNLPAVIVQTRRPTFALRWTNPPQGRGAPIVRADYLACPHFGTAGPCLAGHAIGLNVSRLTTTLPRRGNWRFALWLTDAAGNGTGANAAASELRFLNATALRITRLAIRKARLTVSGRTHSSGTATLGLRIPVKGHTLRIATTTTIRRDRFTLTLRLPRGAHPAPGARALVTLSGDALHAPAHTSRRLLGGRAALTRPPG